MSIREKALTFLKSVLSDIGCDFTDEDNIRQQIVGKDGLKQRKIKIDGLDLVLPTNARLNEPEGETIVFAPFTEDALSGESATFVTLKKLINANLNLRLSTVMSLVAKLATTDGKYPAKLRAIINKCPNVRDKTLPILKRVISRVGNTPSQHVVGIYITSKNVKYEGRKVKRLATVSSTLLDELSDHRCWGVKNVTNKDLDGIAELISAILPGVNGGEYSYGTVSKVAPNLHSLLNAFYNVSSRLAEVESMIYKILPDDKLDKVAAVPTHDWVDGLEDFYAMEKAFPSLTGNNGNTVVGERSNADLSKVKVSESGNAGNTPTRELTSDDAVPSAVPGTSAPTPTATPEAPKKSQWGVPTSRPTPVAGFPGSNTAVPSSVPGHSAAPPWDETPAVNTNTNTGFPR